jgi:hypothetical protein
MICPYCNSPVDFTNSKKIYGKSYGMVYVCSRYLECDAYVGAHRNGGLPKGTLANSRLRNLRMQAHGLFDPLWISRKMQRPIAYRLMRSLMDLPTGEAHIGMMDETRCKEFIEKMSEYLKGKNAV